MQSTEEWLCPCLGILRSLQGSRRIRLDAAYLAGLVEDDPLPEKSLALHWKIPRYFPGWDERNAMKPSKLTDAQKAFTIRQGEDGTPVEEVCRKAGISQATYHAWEKKYAGMMPSR